jgi:hypothetical protein
MRLFGGSVLNILHDNEKDALIIHCVFAVVCAIVLVAPVHLTIGIRMLSLVIIYNLIMPLWGLIRRDRNLINLWLFSLILSLLQVFPDWFLSRQLNVLVFPDDGCFKIGTVSGYMAGLWAIPVFIIVFIGERVYVRYSKQAAYAAVALISLVIFAGSEQTLWMLPSWHAQNVQMIGHIAVYIIVPEILLGLAAYFAYQHVTKLSHWYKFPAAFSVMLFYVGSAAFFYFLIETIIIP